MRRIGMTTVPCLPTMLETAATLTVAKSATGNTPRPASACKQAATRIVRLPQSRRGPFPERVASVSICRLEHDRDEPKQFHLARFPGRTCDLPDDSSAGAGARRPGTVRRYLRWAAPAHPWPAHGLFLLFEPLALFAAGHLAEQRMGRVARPLAGTVRSSLSA
jgi:hypothetical protein